MADYRTVPPDGLPRISTLIVDCPECGKSVEYEPQSDDSGAFYAVEDWPVCHKCEILIDVPGVCIKVADGEPYWISDYK